MCNFGTAQKIVVGKHHSKFRTSLATATTSITNSMAMMEWWPSRPQPGILNENSKPLKATLLDWIRLGWDHPIIYIRIYRVSVLEMDFFRMLEMIGKLNILTCIDDNYVAKGWPFWNLCLLLNKTVNFFFRYLRGDPLNWKN